MNLNAPSQGLFWVAVVIAVIGIIGWFAPTIPIIGPYAFWVAIVAFIVLAAGCLMRRA
jgi:hypothetical protein